MKGISCAVLLIAALFAAGCSSTRNLFEGQRPERFEKEIITNARLKYLLFLPRGISDKTKPWPLMMFLHGSGERGDDIEKVKTHGPPKIVENDPDFPFILVSPQAERFSGWSPDILNALLEDVCAQLPVDPDRIYLTGLSMGGFGTWDFAIKYPEHFAAIAPVCGGGDPESACRLKNVPVWAFHGARDSTVPLSASSEMVDAMKECGGDARLTVYPDAGHDSWTETYANPELYAWFLRHTRKK
jgi:predicted peptidase